MREVHAGGTVFVPANTSIAISNVGSDTLSIGFVFPRLGSRTSCGPCRFAGEKNVPLSKAEDDAIQKKHTHDVTYQ